MSKVVVSTSSGRWCMPCVSSAYARATRSGVSRRPSRSGSSPMAISSSRTAAAARSWSKAAIAVGPSGVTRFTTMPRASRLVALAAAGGRWPRRARAHARVAVDVPTRTGRGEHDGALRSVGDRAVGRRLTDLLGDPDRWDARGPGGRGAGPRGAHRAAAQRLEDLGDLGLVEGLPLHQGEHEGVQDVAVLLEDVEGLLVRGRQELLGLLVDDRGDVLGVVARVPHVAAEERLGVLVTELDRAQPFGHAVLRDHRA